MSRGTRAFEREVELFRRRGEASACPKRCVWASTGRHPSGHPRPAPTGHQAVRRAREIRELQAGPGQVPGRPAGEGARSAKRVAQTAEVAAGAAGWWEQIWLQRGALAHGAWHGRRLRIHGGGLSSDRRSTLRGDSLRRRFAHRILLGDTCAGKPTGDHQKYRESEAGNVFHAALPAVQRCSIR